jgi:hypothetical protein
MLHHALVILIFCAAVARAQTLNHYPSSGHGRAPLLVTPFSAVLPRQSFHTRLQGRIEHSRPKILKGVHSAAK